MHFKLIIHLLWTVSQQLSWKLSKTAVLWPALCFVACTLEKSRLTFSFSVLESVPNSKACQKKQTKSQEQQCPLCMGWKLPDFDFWPDINPFGVLAGKGHIWIQTLLGFYSHSWCETRLFIMICPKKDYCEKEVQVQGHLAMFPEFCCDILACGHRLDGFCFSLCRPAGHGWQARCHLPHLCFQPGVTRRRAHSALSEENTWVPWGHYLW